MLPTHAARPRPATVARVLGTTVFVAGCASLASAMNPLLRSRLLGIETLVTPGADEIAAGTSAVLGIALLLVGRGVMHRRRAAARAAIALLLAAAAIHLAQHAVLTALACAVLAVALVRARSTFVVIAEPRRARHVARLVVALLVLDFVAGLVAIALQHSHVEPAPTPRSAFHEVAARLIGSHGPLDVRAGGTWFPGFLTFLGLVTCAVVVIAALAPVTLRGGGDELDRAHVRRLVDRSDADTLAPFALRRDKRYVFSADARAAIAYRYLNGAGLAAGNPVGDARSFPSAIASYIELCDRHGWKPAVYGAGEDVVPMYRAAGLRSFYIGDEAIIDVDVFTLAGRAMRGVRQAVHRVERAGITVSDHREGDLDDALRQTLLEIAATQRGRAPERGFSMTLGGLLDGSQPNCTVFVAHDASGAPIAFQRYVPCGRGRALSLDITRRLRGGPNGVNEFIIAHAVAWAREHSFREVSLNFAAFRALFEEDADLESMQKIEALLIRRLEGRFGIQMDSLRQFNAKFRPRWVPRHLVFRRPGDLPAVGVAALSAEAFLPFDRHREPAPST